MLSTNAARAEGATIGSTTDAEAPRHRLVFRPEWRRFELVDYVTTSIFGFAYFYVEFLTEIPTKPGWTGPILFDADARDALVADTRDGRNRAAAWSDVFWVVPLTTPFVESAFVPLFDRWNWDVAWQLSAMNLQAAAINSLLTRSGHHLIGRERPDVAPCKRDPNYDDKCFGGSNASFPSGHTSTAFVGAGLSCAHHSNLPLYGGGAPDIAMCVAMTLMSVGNGIERMVADRHYASDVIAGAALGVATGFGMPVLLHYWGVGTFSTSPVNAGARDARMNIVVSPFVAPEGAGATATGFF